MQYFLTGIDGQCFIRYKDIFSDASVFHYEYFFKATENSVKFPGVCVSLIAQKFRKAQQAVKYL